jgi:PAS domain S-box-containing protein
MIHRKPYLEKVLLNNVLDNLPALVFRAINNDNKWTFAYASEGSKALLGYAPEELIDLKTFEKMIPKEDHEQNTLILEKITPLHPHYKIVYRIRTIADQIKWVQEEGTGAFSNTGSLEYLDGFLMDITDQKLKEEHLLKENIRLRTNIHEQHRLDNLIGKGMAMQALYDLILKAAKSPATVVITGESGTGKELASRAIHNLCDQNEKPFVVVNCGAIADSLFESEFFGYRKGAFSGALTDRQGFMDVAKGGTLFLDEIGEIPLILQVKLLRALDGNGYIPVGSTSVRHSDFRLIVATNRDLEELVRSGYMREDFYYRINGIRIRMPPLRERKDDILMLAEYFINKYSGTKPPPWFSEQDQSVLLKYNWPGNVRELQNVIHRFLINNTIELTGSILSKNRPSKINSTNEKSGTFGLGEEINQKKKEMILEVLNCNKWHIRKSSEALGISLRTMQRRMNQYNLKK